MPGTIEAIREREKALLEHNEIYRQILDALTDMVLVKGAHSRILWGNRAFRDYYGMSNEELQGLVDAPFNAPDHTQQYVADDAHVFSTGEPLDIPMEPVTRHDGNVGLFHTVKSALRDDDGVVRMTVGVSRNIGETLALRDEVMRYRKQLERDRLSSFAAHLPGFLFQIRLEGETYHFSYVGPRVVEFYGVTEAELRANPMRLLDHAVPHDVVREELSAAFRQAIADGSPIAHVHRVRPPGRRPRFMELLGRARLEEDGSVTFYAYAHDVSERVGIEREREALIETLKVKNHEMEQFTYTISHDLKSPLVTIRGFVGGIEEDIRQGRLDRALTDLGRIRAAAEKMSRMLAELLELSRVGRVAHAPTTFEVGEVIAEARELLAARLDGTQVTIDATGCEVRLQADRLRLVQVFQNLIENAVKYMGPQEQPRVSIRCHEEGDWVVISVADNGIGIDPAHHQRVFGLFEKLNTRSEGTGVGLALVKSIVELHRGKVWVESAGVGHGTTIHVRLPRHPPADAAG